MASLIASHNLPVELVFLPRFQRYIVICPNPQISQQTKLFLEEQLKDRADVSYSMRNNPLLVPCDGNWALESDSKTIDYLEIPLEEGSKRFLILPPLSPQNEWDHYDMREEGPNKTAVYSPDELAHLLWDRLGGFRSTRVRRFEEEAPEENSDSENESTLKRKQLPIYDLSTEKHVLFENIPAGVPAIVLDTVSNHGPSARSIPKTAIPPSNK